MSSPEHDNKARTSRVFSSKTSIFAAVFVVVVVLLGAFSLEFQFSALSVSPSASRPASFSSSVSPLGLQLRVAFDATAIGRYGALRVRTEVVNTLDRNVSITLGQVNANISAWNAYDFFCGVNIAESLAGFALFRGSYSAANISQAGNPLQLAPFVRTTCPVFPYPQEIVLKPMSNLLAISNGPRAGIALNVTSEQCVSLSPTVHQCGPSTGLFGSWNTQSFLNLDGATFRSPYFQYLVPGVYTLVAADAWGQAVYAHFEVL